MTEVANPLATEQSRQLKQAASTEVAVQRELAEVQAAVLMARRFPRDPVQAMDAILRACTRPSLAQGALYNFPRGGTEVEGPSIRLAEVLAQSWGNLAFGVRELEQRPGESTMEAFCWDMETNVRQNRVFQVRHQRHTKGGSYALTDPRDIYEANANQGARRLRACILGVIPGDVIEAATQQCEATLKAEADISPDGLKKLVEAFASFGVTQQQIERRCQRRVDTIRPAQVVQLRKIWASLRDEMSQPADWFDMPQQQPAEPPATGNEALRQKLAPEPPAPVWATWDDTMIANSFGQSMTKEQIEKMVGRKLDWHAIEVGANTPPQSAFAEMAQGLQPKTQRLYKQPPKDDPLADPASGSWALVGGEMMQANPASTPGGSREEGTPIPPPPAGDAPPIAAEPSKPYDSTLSGLVPAGDGSAIEELKPKRSGRTGWDWADYTERYIALGTSLPRARLGEFRGRQASMFDVLRQSNNEQWTRANQALAEYERERDC